MEQRRPRVRIFFNSKMKQKRNNDDSSLLESSSNGGGAEEATKAETAAGEQPSPAGSEVKVFSKWMRSGGVAAAAANPNTKAENRVQSRILSMALNSAGVRKNAKAENGESSKEKPREEAAKKPKEKPREEAAKKPKKKSQAVKRPSASGDGGGQELMDDDDVQLRKSAKAENGESSKEKPREEAVKKPKKKSQAGKRRSASGDGGGQEPMDDDDVQQQRSVDLDAATVEAASTTTTTSATKVVPKKRKRIEWNRLSMDHMSVKRNSSIERPFASSSGMSHVMPSRSPRILTSLDGSLTLAPFFTNKFAFSNHFMCRFTVDGIEFNCTEQFYMYYKAQIFGDRGSAAAVMRSVDSKEIKRMGARIRLFDTKLWRKVSIMVMVIANRSKYAQNSVLRRLLFETGDALLVEASPDDIYWGIGIHVDSPANIRDVRRWRALGKNVMGRILTRIRDSFKVHAHFRAEWEEVRAQLPKLEQDNNNMARRTM